MGNAFYRDKSQGVIGGVCAGLAQYFGVSPLLLRLIFVLLTFSGGPAVPAYILLWILLPDKPTVGTARHATVRDNVRDIESQARNLSQELGSVLGSKRVSQAASGKRILWLGAILILVGLVSLADALNLLSWFRPDLLWAVALILAGAVMLSRALRGK